MKTAPSTAAAPPINPSPYKPPQQGSSKALYLMLAGVVIFFMYISNQTSSINSKESAARQAAINAARDNAKTGASLKKLQRDLANRKAESRRQAEEKIARQKELKKSPILNNIENLIFPEPKPTKSRIVSKAKKAKWIAGYKSEIKRLTGYYLRTAPGTHRDLLEIQINTHIASIKNLGGDISGLSLPSLSQKPTVTPGIPIPTPRPNVGIKTSQRAPEKVERRSLDQINIDNLAKPGKKISKVIITKKTTHIQPNKKTPKSQSLGTYRITGRFASSSAACTRRQNEDFRLDVSLVDKPDRRRYTLKLYNGIRGIFSCTFDYPKGGRKILAREGCIAGLLSPWRRISRVWVLNGGSTIRVNIRGDGGDTIYHDYKKCR